MTATIDRPVTTTLPERIPAWGVSVDLTPREIVQGRQTKVVQRLVALGLVVVLLACGGLAVMAFGDRSTAQSDYDDAQSQTTQLQDSSHDYDGLVAMTRVTQDTDLVAAGLMGQDVDVVNLIARIRQATPAGVTIGNVTVLLAPDPAAAAATTGTVGTGGTVGGEASGAPIGTITISGAGDRIKALAPFVARLNHMRGVTGVVPTSTTQTEAGMVYSLTMSFTDDLYTHRFDADAAGSTASDAQ